MMKMKVRMIKTHNPQDYFEGIEDPALTETTIESVDLPEPIAVPLDDGYCVILRKISGQIKATYRKPDMNPMLILWNLIRLMFMQIIWRLRRYGKK